MWLNRFHRVRRLRRASRQVTQTIGMILTELRAHSERLLPTMLVWLRAAWIGPLYLSFEAYAYAWNFVQPHIKATLGVTASNTHRFIFCLALSVVIGHVIFWQTGVGLSFWTLALCTIHSLVIHCLWSNGARWCKRQLGIRPSRYVDPKKPFAGLDLGN